MILALDCATHTGWAYIDKGKIVESGVQDFSKKRGESNGIMFMRFRKWLSDMITDDVKCVGYERAHGRGGAATEIMTNMTGRVQEICAEKGVEYNAIPSATIKKFATGKGNAGKDMVIAYAKTILGRDPISDDEADAVAIAMYMSDMIEVINE